MKSSKVYIGLAAGGIAAMISGCATSPSTNANLMREHRSEVEVRAQAESELKDQLAQDWENGQNLIASGNQNIENGEKMMDSADRAFIRGRDRLELGKRELAEGTDLVRNSEARFRDEFGDLDLSEHR